MNSPGVPPEGPPQNATGAESQSIPKKAKRTVELVRARHETLIRRVLVGWGQGTSTQNGRPTLIAKQQLILRDLVIEMAVELGQAEGRELLARSRAPEQFESDLSSLLKSTANNSLARWRSITEWYDLRAQGTKKAGSQEVEIQKCVLYRLIPFAESLKLKAWSTHRTRLEAEGRTEVRKIADLVEGSACTHAVRTTAAPNQRIGDLSDENATALTRHEPAKTIDRLRHEKGWTIEGLAAQAGVDTKQIYKIKHGKPVTTTTITRVAAALGCPPGDLIPATPPLKSQR